MIALDCHEWSACILHRLRAVHYWWPVNGRTWSEPFLYTHSLIKREYFHFLQNKPKCFME